MKIAILTTGNEIMAGNITDSNAAWISDKCWMLGHRVSLHMAVGDNEAELTGALKYAADHSDIVIVTGGLGATVDDITLATAAKLLGLKMEFHEDVWCEIKNFFKEINRVCSENNKKQAYMPQGAKELKNRVGTAPGIRLNHKGKEYLFLPGVPEELKQIFNDFIFSWIKEKSDMPGYYEKYIRLFGLPEATYDQMIQDIEYEGVDLNFRVHFPEAKIKLAGRAEEKEMAKYQVDKAVTLIKEKLGDFIYAEDDIELEEVVGNILINKEYELVVAESCTGGLIANRLTNVSGSSAYFDRGFVVYSNKSKRDNLGVPEETLTRFGAVSSEAALAMSEGAISKSVADIALAVTGIAGPTGGTKEKPVGTAYVAVTGPKGSVCRHYVYPRSRKQFKEIVAETALDMLRRYLLDLEI